MIIKVEQIMYDFKLRKIIAYCSNNTIYVFCSRERQGSIFPKNTWIEITDSEVGTLSHGDIVHMIGGKMSEE